MTAGFVLNLTSSVRLDLGVQQAVYGRNNDRVTFVLTNLSMTF